LTEPPIGVAVSGATGATGSLVVREVAASPAFVLTGALAAAGTPEIGDELGPGVRVTDKAAAALSGARVVIDFSAPAGVNGLLDALREHPVPTVIGTTGLGRDLRARIDALATHAPVVFAPNMSLGVNVLRRLVRQAAAAVGPGWDAEIVEIHHRRKKDAPSGTALALTSDIASTVGGEPVLQRAGLVGARSDREIGVQALRGGDVVGEHTVMLVGHGERIELIHRASDRTTFAAGALRAAAWLCEPDRSPGLYSMDDVLFGDSP